MNSRFGLLSDDWWSHNRWKLNRSDDVLRRDCWADSENWNDSDWISAPSLYISQDQTRSLTIFWFLEPSKKLYIYNYNYIYIPCQRSFFHWCINWTCTWMGGVPVWVYNWGVITPLYFFHIIILDWPVIIVHSIVTPVFRTNHEWRT